jgi:hypothetical protein
MTVVVYGQNGSVKFVPATCSLFRLAAISIVGLSTNEAADDASIAAAACSRLAKRRVLPSTAL